MEITTVIIDDQQDSIDDLLYIIKKEKLPLNVVGTANSGSEGLVTILKYKPKLVFLDIIMPGMTGFEMIDLLPGLDFQLIVTTSMDKFAVQAIRASALDFLLKPVKPSELKDAVDRVLSQNITPTTRQQVSLLHDNFHERNQPIKKIALAVSDGIELALLEDILYFESDGNYTTVHFKDGKSIVVTKQIGKFEEIVNNSSFYRIHNSYIVNVNAIKKLVRSDGGYVILENNKTISISRTRKEAFFEFIGGI